MPLAEQFDFSRATRVEYDKTAQKHEHRVNFESIWCPWPDDGTETVTVGNGAHFDAAIVTVPVAALGRVSKQVTQSRYKNSRGEAVGPQWKAMLEEMGTVATQSMQLWVNRGTRALGWKHGQVSFSAFVHPFDTWADLSHLIGVEEPGETAGSIRARPGVSVTVDTQPGDNEDVPSNEVRGVHYFCSVLPERQIPRALRAGPNRDRLDLDRTRWIAKLRDTVRDNGRYFLDEWIFHLWPDAVYRYPTAFKWTSARRPEEPAWPQSPGGPARGGECRPVGTVHVEPAGHDAVSAAAGSGCGAAPLRRR